MGRNRGFTLIEILCAVVVLGLMVLIIGQFVSETAKTISFNENRAGLEGEMRTIFASMSTDLTSMVKRTDMDNLFVKQGSGTPGVNDYMFFYSDAPAYFDSTVASTDRSPFSIIGYCIAPSAGIYRLQRYSRGLSWESPQGGSSDTWGPAFLSYPAAAHTNAYVYPASAPIATTQLPNGPWSGELPTGTVVPSNTNYHVVGADVFRLEFCFLRSDGSIADAPVISTSAPTYWHPLTDVVAVIVTIAMLDVNSQKLINRKSSMATLAGNFSDSGFTTPKASGSAPLLMATAWQNKVVALCAAPPTGMPPLALSHIRIYQHFFSLSND